MKDKTNPLKRWSIASAVLVIHISSCVFDVVMYVCKYVRYVQEECRNNVVLELNYPLIIK